MKYISIEVEQTLVSSMVVAVPDDCDIKKLISSDRLINKIADFSLEACDWELEYGKGININANSWKYVDEDSFPDYVLTEKDNYKKIS